MTSFDEQLHRFVGRMPFGERIRPYINRLASFGEQGLQGLANLLVNIILARHLSREGFATIGTMIGIHYFVLGIHRTAIVLPYILGSSDGDDHGDDEQRRTYGSWWWLNFASLGLIAACLTLVAGGALWFAGDNSEQGWFVEAIALTAPVTPALLLFEFGRRCLYQAGLPASAALASTIYLAINLSLALLFVRIDAAPVAGALAWIAAGLVAGMITTIMLPPGRPRFRQGFLIWARHRRFAGWQVLTTIPYVIYNSSVVVLIGIVNGPLPTAAFNAARSLTNPAISMVSAIDSLDKPRAARAFASEGIPGLLHSIARTRRLLGILTGCYLGAMIVLAEPILSLAFGTTYAGHVTAFRILCAVFFTMCMNQPSDTLLIVLKESRLLLLLRSMTAVSVVALLFAARPFGLIGCCFALLAANLFNLAILRIGERIAIRRRVELNATDDRESGHGHRPIDRRSFAEPAD